MGRESEIRFITSTAPKSFAVGSASLRAGIDTLDDSQGSSTPLDRPEGGRVHPDCRIRGSGYISNRASSPLLTLEALWHRCRKAPSRTANCLKMEDKSSSEQNPLPFSKMLIEKLGLQGVHHPNLSPLVDAPESRNLGNVSLKETPV